MKNFLQDYLRNVSLLHDQHYHKDDLPGPGLITPTSRLGRRVYYEIDEFDEPLDSVNIVGTFEFGWFSHCLAQNARPQLASGCVAADVANSTAAIAACRIWMTGYTSPKSSEIRTMTGTALLCFMVPTQWPTPLLYVAPSVCPLCC